VVFVIGYAFKDPYLATIFRYAVAKNTELIIFLISPSAYSVYKQKLEFHQDDEFKKSFTSSSSSDSSTAPVPSLSGRVICLNYGIENIIPYLRIRYLITLRKAQDAERIQKEHEIKGENTKWNDCIKYYVDCEHIEKANKMIEEVEWGRLVSDDWKYSFEISLKGLLTSLLNEDDYIISKWRDYLERVLEKFSFENFVFSSDLGMQTPSFRAHIDLAIHSQGSIIPSHELAQTIDHLIHLMEDKLQLITGDTKHTNIIEFLDRENGFFGKLKKLSQDLNPWSGEKMTFQGYLDTRGRYTDRIEQLRPRIRDFETNTSLQNKIGQRRITEILSQIELIEIQEIYGGDIVLHA
jgi:hypothetical protein